jgi:hypothetical protein
MTAERVDIFALAIGFTIASCWSLVSGAVVVMGLRAFGITAGWARRVPGIRRGIICECWDAIGGTPAEFAKSTSWLKRPSKYRRQHIRPCKFEICSQRNASRVTGMEIARERFLNFRVEALLLTALLLLPGCNHPVLGVL